VPFHVSLGVKIPFVVCRDDLGNLFLGERYIGKSPYLSDSAFYDGDLVKPSAITEDNAHDLIAHARFRFID